MFDPKLEEGRQRQALGPKPEGAEKRFSEHVAEEILAGRFELSFWNYFDRNELVSMDADKYRYDVKEGQFTAANYDKFVFGLTARKTWFGYGKAQVALTRGRKNITDLLAPFEVELLADAYFRGLVIWREKTAEKQQREEAKRQRAAWWP